MTHDSTNQHLSLEPDYDGFDPLEDFEDDATEVEGRADEFVATVSAAEDALAHDAMAPATPVSYTHLDVYKRQVRGGEPCSRRAAELEEPKGGSPSVSRETFVLLPQDVSRETSVLLRPVFLGIKALLVR